MEEYVALVPPEEEKRKAMKETDPLPRRPESYWWPALGAMILCCMPCGIIALITAYQAEDRYDMGDYEGSVKLAKRAQRWVMWSVATKVVSVGFITIITVIYCAVLLKLMSEAHLVDGEEAGPAIQ